jgi:hypothetical protein
MVSVSLSVCCINSTLRQIKYQRTSMSMNFQLAVQHCFCTNLTLYPLLLIVCWTPSTIVYIYSIATLERPDLGGILRTLQYTLSFLQGFLNCLAYLYNFLRIRQLLSLQSSTTANNNIRSPPIEEVNHNSQRSLAQEVQKYNSSGSNSVDILLDL